MKRLLFLSTIFTIISITSSGQGAVEFRDDQLDYYSWFHEYSNTADLYRSGKLIYTFVEDAPIHREACVESAILTALPVGFPMTNLFDETAEVIWESVNGYNDIWYRVKGFDQNRERFVGYIWGGYIAKAFQPAFITGDGGEEFILLGISGKKRKDSHDFMACLKVVSENTIIAEATVPNMCLSEECSSDALVRVLTDQPFKGEIMIEASSMTVSCITGVEKNYFSWRNGELEHVYNSSLPHHKVVKNRSFSYQSESETILCRYSRETADFTPVWSCKRIKKKVGPRA